MIWKLKKKKILKDAREKPWTNISLTSDLSSEIMEAREKWHMFKCWKKVPVSHDFCVWQNYPPKWRLTKHIIRLKKTESFSSKSALKIVKGSYSDLMKWWKKDS